MSVNVVDFKVRFPEFDAIADPRVQLFIDDAIAELNQVRWEACKRYDRGICYLAAHWLYLGEQTAAGDASGGGGGVTSKSVGAVSLGYGGSNEAMVDPADTQFMRTEYGMEYLRLQRFVGLGAYVGGDVTHI